MYDLFQIGEREVVNDVPVGGRLGMWAPERTRLLRLTQHLESRDFSVKELPTSAWDGITLRGLRRDWTTLRRKQLAVRSGVAIEVLRAYESGLADPTPTDWHNLLTAIFEEAGWLDS
jgi:hypothetical protein